MIGETISHYKITSEIGAGGMGVVYEAEDLNLKRTVALKFLPPDLTRDAAARKRFIVEAQTASAIDHPNVCTIHEVGETDDGRVFIAMARYTGETLRDRIARGPVPADEALGIAGQIAAGLAKAHSQDIVHRDIKPGNIFITEDGGVKILDFGLARIAGESRMTKTGTTVGTVAYMSPEQAEGRDVDARADVWALGAVLYEMLAGRPAFRGDAEPAIVNSILTTEPEPVTSIRREVPVGVEDVVDKALAKDPGKRYQTAAELGVALAEQRDLAKAGIRTGGSVAWKRFRRNRRAVSGVILFGAIALAVLAVLLFDLSTAEPEFMAVLPLEIVGGTTSQDTLNAEGMAQELIATFSKMDNLRVISSKSSTQYRDSEKPLKQIGEELGANLLLTGSVRHVDDDLTISAEVVEAATGVVVWSDIFDENVSNVFRLQSRIARSVAGALELELSPETQARLASMREVDPDAYEAYQWGVHWLETSDSNCVAHFERAIELDPDYALPYAGLAEFYIQLGHDRSNAKSLGEKAKKYALRSLEIDPDLAEGHAALAHILWEYDFEMERAGEEFDRTFQLNPSYTYGMIPYLFYLSSLSLVDEAVEVAFKARQLNPRSPWAQLYPNFLLARAGHVDEAISHLEQAVEIFPEWKPAVPGWVATMYIDAGLPEEAIAVLDTIPAERMDRETAVELALCFYAAGQNERGNTLVDSLDSLTGAQAVSPLALGGLWAARGDSARAAGYLEEADSMTLYPALYLNLAANYAEIGNFDKAFAVIESMYQTRNSWLTRLRDAENQNGKILEDPRYQEWVDKLNLNMYD